MSASTVLVINSGSSSLKFSLFNIATGEEIVTGLAERLGNEEAVLSWKFDGNRETKDIAQASHREALQAVMSVLHTHQLLGELLAVGHRVVHGGEYFYESVLIDDVVLQKITACNRLAPLHNPAHVIGIEVMRELFPALPQVAVFDTAFHQSMPKEAYTYALPYELYEKYGVRRYGAHGTSHKYVSGEAVTRLGLDPNNHGIVTAHLGNGCSATAVHNGKSVDTTMGMTPLEGLMMGTRCGDIDPSLHEFLMSELNLSISDVTNMLNKKSGLLGVSGLSNDMRTLCEAAETGNERAQLAIDVFCYRLAKYICALPMPLGRLDALVFTGGIGENARIIRANVINHLNLLGFKLDAERNQSNGKTSHGVITEENSPIAIVINTAEEWVIAQDTARLTSHS